MRKLNKKGFTLIELLVVIAIIGILASIVLVSLNSARQKGYDTEVKSEMAQIKNAMEMCYDTNNGAYTNCGTDVLLGTTAITPPACSQVAYIIAVTAQTYNIEAKLCSSATLKWCVDETGVSIVSSDAGVCP